MLQADIGDVQIAPNPANNFVQISLETSEPFSVDIYSILGQKILVQSSQNSSLRLDLSAIPNGLYLVSIHSGNTRIVRRLKVNH